mgnify:CR=1 FL=1
MTASFVHLRLHTEFSLVDGLVRVKPLVKAVAAAGMPAVAVTDMSNMCSLVKFYKTAMGAGIKPICGADIWLASAEEDGPLTRLTLLAMNAKGYRNLTELISRGWAEGQSNDLVIIQRDWVKEAAEGLIALSGAREGEVGQALLAGDEALAETRLREWMAVFPDRFYLEVQRTSRVGDEEYLHAAVALADRVEAPLVATNDVRFIKQDDFEAHETRVCIGEGRTLDDPRRPRNYSDQQYLKTPAEMWELFSDLPEALENSVEIAKRCNVTVRLGEYFLPNFPTGDMTTEDFLVMKSKEGLEERLAFLFPDPAVRAERRPEYDERLDIELKVINQMGFPGYFLIVMEFIQWSKDNGIPVGPGRGSGAGSLVAYALKITDLDPLEFDLLFERFLNPERVSMPDFDVDFCMDRRDEVIDHVSEMYGREAVSQIITFGSMAAKAVVRDVGRVLGHAYGFVDRISKLIPPDPGMTLAKAFEAEPKLPELYEQDEEVKDLIDMARRLEGVVRNAGKHAGGVVIAPTKITDFAPLYCDDEGHHPVTQFDKNDVEYAGLVKFDFLGLRTLTIIDWALGMINPRLAKEGKPPVDIAAIPIDDKKSFALLQRFETTAVFQLESRGMKDLIKRLQPDCFEDMIALVALFRPGPLQSGMVDNFIERKHGKEAISYPDEKWQHESLKPILEPTYGIILYQEQVMQIAQTLAGYTLGGADMLRRAMGKKKPEEMAKQRAGFEEGAVKNGVDGELAMKIFDLVEKFAGYGFNKSHSAAYALVSYQTLWLKTHFPAEFMAAVMTADMDNTDKIVTLVDECQRMGLTVIPPDVNTGRYRFSVNEDGHIVYGIGAVKGVGEGPIEAILDARDRDGPFRDLFDFCNRVDIKKLNKRVMEKLILSGAMDRLGPHRAALMATLEEAMRAAEQHAKAQAVGQVDMFGVLTEEIDDVKKAFANVPHWPDKVWLEGERETLGLYLTGHPINQYSSELRRYTSGRLCDLHPTSRDTVTTAAGLVIAARSMVTKRGNKMGIFTLDDRSGRLDVTLFSEALEKYEELMQKDRILVVSGQVSFDDFSGGLKMSARELLDINDARERFARAIRISLDEQRIDERFFPRLCEILEPARAGVCPVQVNYRRPGSRVRLTLGTEWRVTPTDQLIDDLRVLLGRERVELVFD